MFKLWNAECTLLKLSLYRTRLPFNLRPTTSKRVHLVTCGNLRSRDKDGSHTIRPNIAKNHMLHAEIQRSMFYRSTVTAYQSFTLWHFYIFAPVTLTWWPSPDDLHIQTRLFSQMPKLCVKISIFRHRRMWVRSFSTRLTSVTFAEDKVLIFLILRKNAKIVQLWV